MKKNNDVIPTNNMTPLKAMTSAAVSCKDNINSSDSFSLCNIMKDSILIFSVPIISISPIENFQT